MFVAGPQRPHGPPHSVANLDSFHADLLSLVLPSGPQLLRPSLLHRTAEHFVKGTWHENGFYLGLPLLAPRGGRCAAAPEHVRAELRDSRHGLVRAQPRHAQLTVANHLTPIPMPIAAVTGLPMLQEIGPTTGSPWRSSSSPPCSSPRPRPPLERFAHDRLRRYGRAHGLRCRPRPPPARRLIRQHPGTHLGALLRQQRRQGDPGRSDLLPYPFPFYSTNVAMVWQMASDMRFRMPGGEIYVPGPSGRSTELLRADLPPSLWAVLVQGGPQRGQALGSHQHRHDAEVSSQPCAPTPRPRMDAVVVSATGAQGRWMTALTRSAFGAPTTVHGDISVWVKPVLGVVLPAGRIRP